MKHSELIVTPRYNGLGVTFDFSSGDGMINATQMAKIFDQDPNEFIRLPSTDKFIEALVRDENLRQEQRLLVEIANDKMEEKEDLIPGLSRNKNSEITREDVLKTVRGRYQSGTWMHRLLAYKFAAWLDVDFELWVYRVVDDFAFGELLTQRQRLVEMTEKETRRLALEAEFGEMEKYRELQSLRASKNNFLNAPKKAAMAQLNLMFDKNKNQQKK